MMQETTVEKVEITPEEVRQFFQSIPIIDLPIFGTELEIAQIIIEPKVSEEEKPAKKAGTKKVDKEISKDVNE